MSDVGHWKEFGEFLAPDELGVMRAPVVTPGAVPSLPYDGGIGYAVAKGTQNPDLAADLVRSLTSTGALAVFPPMPGRSSRTPRGRLGRGVRPRAVIETAGPLMSR